MSFRVPLGCGARNLESVSGECLKISPPVFTGVEMADEREKRIATQPLSGKGERYVVCAGQPAIGATMSR
jgi:hypothetical protein